MTQLFDKPGAAYVGMTRVKEPKDLHIPDSEYPTALDLRVQRLKNF